MMNLNMRDEVSCLIESVIIRNIITLNDWIDQSMKELNKLNQINDHLPYSSGLI